MLDFLGGLIGAGASLFGQSESISAQQGIAAQNIAEQNFLSSGGNLPGLVANAKKAGINPLAALGYSGGSAPSNSISGAGAGIAEAGQDIQRAISAYMDHQQQKDQAQIDLMRAQSDKVRSDALANLDNVTARHYNVPGSPPALPHIEGFHPGRTDFIRRIHVPSGYTWARMEDGSIMRVPTKEFSQQTMTKAAEGPSWYGGLQSLFGTGADYDKYTRSVAPNWDASSAPYVPAGVD